MGDYRGRGVVSRIVLVRLKVGTQVWITVSAYAPMDNREKEAKERF